MNGHMLFKEDDEHKLHLANSGYGFLAQAVRRVMSDPDQEDTKDFGALAALGPYNRAYGRCTLCELLLLLVLYPSFSWFIREK